MPSAVTILGFFPPPVTGQAIATERLRRMLEPHLEVEVLDISYKVPVVHTRERFTPERMLHYVRQFRHIAPRLYQGQGPVIWPAIAASVPGHARDLLTIGPALAARRPVLAVVHRGNLPELFRRPLTAPSARWLVDRLAGLVMNAESLAAPLRPFVPEEKLLLMPNTVDPEWPLSASELEARLPHHPRRPFRILFLSNMLPEKGLWDTLEAVVLLHEQGLPVEAHVIGGWTDTVPPGVFHSWVTEHRAETYTFHHGQITEPEHLRRHVEEADVLVLPTYYPVEAQPHVLIEAMALGTPVITTRQGSIPDMLDPSEAFFVPHRDPGAIAEALTALMEPDTWRTRSRAVWQRFQRQFHPDIIQQRWLNLLQPWLQG